MNFQNEFSPFYEIRSLLKLLRCTCGFPIQVKNETFTSFRFTPWLESVRFSSLIVFHLLDFLYLTILVLLCEGDFNQLFALYAVNYDNLMRSKIDQLSSAFFYVISIKSTIIYFLVFKSSVDSISDLCKEMSKAKAMLKTNTDARKMDNLFCTKCNEITNSTKTVMYGQILSLLTSVVWALWCFNYFQSLADLDVFVRYGAMVHIVYPILFFIQHLFNFYGPMACTAELIIGQIVDSISKLFSDWEEKFSHSLGSIDDNNDNRNSNSHHNLDLNLQNDYKTSDEVPLQLKHQPDQQLEVSLQKVEELSEIGLKLENIVHLANRSLQGLIATFCFNVIGSLIVVIYQNVSSLGLNTLISGSLRTLQILSFSLAATMYLTRFYRIMDTGQRLSCTISKSRRAFENYVIGNTNNEVQNGGKQKLLQKRLQVYQYVSPISPYNVFGLNNKTFYATIATIISYIVILIKLRGMDVPATSINLSATNNTEVL